MGSETTQGRGLRRPSGLTFGAMAAAAVLAVVFSGEALAGCSDPPGPKVDWSNCNKVRKSMKGDNFSGAIFNATDLSRSDFLGAKFVKADLTEANLYRARLNEADLTDAVMIKVEATRANFVKATLTRTKAAKAELLRADFTGAKITESDLSKAELGRTDFRRSTLERVSFRYSNLARADFRDSRLTALDMTGAYTYRTRLEGVDLRDVAGLSPIQLELACGDGATRLPGDLTAPESWPCEVDD